MPLKVMETLTEEFERRWVSCSEAAKILGLDTSTIRRWCRKKRLDAFKESSRWWVSREALASK
jgi:excisionase family DNA binding protein